MTNPSSIFRDLLAQDAGLQAALSAQDLEAGLVAVDTLAAQLWSTIAGLGVNADGLITVSDIEAISAAVRGDATALATFTTARGAIDAVNGDWGYQILHGAGSTLEFLGKNLANKVVNSIFSYGYPVTGGFMTSDNGPEGRTAATTAGWLNYFLNGVNVVHGTSLSDKLWATPGTGGLFAGAENELWLAGAGTDRVRAGEGQDTVWAGSGDDDVGGGTGADVLHGESGHDNLRGEEGNDLLTGGEGNDSLSGGAGDDTLQGDGGHDRLRADEGNDLVSGGDGDDTLYGQAGDDTVLGGAGADMLLGDPGNDLLQGGAGADRITAGEGADTIEGGAGADVIRLVEAISAQDVLIFHAGDSGLRAGSFDIIAGFEHGVDKIDLTEFTGLTFEASAFTGTAPSAYFDGRALRIDTDGDGTADMKVLFQGGVTLDAGDFLLA